MKRKEKDDKKENNSRRLNLCFCCYIKKVIQFCA
jgi:hypothetical protein